MLRPAGRELRVVRWVSKPNDVAGLGPSGTAFLKVSCGSLARTEGGHRSKIGYYRLEMAAEFPERGENDEFSVAGEYGLVLHVPSVLMRDVDGVEADFHGGIDVAARAIADHPAVGFHDFVLVDQHAVGFGIFLCDDLDKFKESLKAGTLDFGGLLGGFAFGEENQTVAFG